VSDGARILQACLQKGKFATKYSNIFDLKSGEIFLFPIPEKNDQVKFSLAEELKRGPHYYDIPGIHEQLSAPRRPLLANMQPRLLADYKPIADHEPKVTEHVGAMWRDILNGTLHADDYTASAWEEISTDVTVSQAIIKSLGNLMALNLVDRSKQGRNHTYRYILKFEHFTLLQSFVFDDQKKVVSSAMEDMR